VRMTKPNSASSHDWHVQLCCQRSGLPPPKRAALDQGRTRPKPDCVLELDGAVLSVWGLLIGSACYRMPALDVLPGVAVSYLPTPAFESHSAASDVLRELSETILILAWCQPGGRSFSGFSRKSVDFLATNQIRSHSTCLSKLRTALVYQNNETPEIGRGALSS
jgi:hypothetical protein